MNDKQLIDETRVKNVLYRTRQVVDTLQVANAELELAQGKLVELVQQRNGQVAKAEAQSRGYQSMASVVLGANAQLQEQLSNSDSEKRKLVDEQGKLVGVIQSKSAEVTGLKKIVDRQELEIDFLDDNKERLVSEVIALERDLSNGKETLAASESSLAKTSTDVQRLRVYASELARERSALFVSNKDLAHRYFKAAGQISNLDVHAAKLSDKVADLEADVYDEHSLAGRYQDAQLHACKTVGVQERDINVLEGDYARLEAVAGKLAINLKNAGAMIEKQGKRLSSQKATIRRLNEFGEEADELYAQSEAELKDARDEASRLRQHNGELVNEKFDLESLADVLGAAVDIAVEANVELQARLYDADCNVGAGKVAFKELEGDYARLEAVAGRFSLALKKAKAKSANQSATISAQDEVITEQAERISEFDLARRRALVMNRINADRASKLAADLSYVQSRAVDLDVAVDAAVEANVELQARLYDADCEVGVQKARVGKFSAKSKKAGKIVAGLKSTVADLEADVYDVEAEKHELKRKLDADEADIAKHEVGYRQLERAAYAVVDKLKTSRARSENQTATINAQDGMIREQAERISEFDLARRRALVMNRINANRASRAVDLDVAVDTAVEANVELQARLYDADCNVGVQKARVGKFSAKSKKAGKIVAGLKSTVADLEADVYDAQVQLANRDGLLGMHGILEPDVYKDRLADGIKSALRKYTVGSVDEINSCAHHIVDRACEKHLSGFDVANVIKTLGVKKVGGKEPVFAVARTVHSVLGRISDSSDIADLVANLAYNRNNSLSLISLQ